MEETKTETTAEERKLPEKPLEKLTAPELREIAKGFGVEGTHAMKKEELITVLKEAYGIKDEGPDRKSAKSGAKTVTVEAVKETGCHGFCEQGPLVVIEPHGTFYTHVKPKDVEAIVDKSIAAGEVIEPLLYTNPVTGDKIERYHDVGFFTHQHRIALGNLGKIAAHDIREYIAVGGNHGLAKVLTTMNKKLR